MIPNLRRFTLDHIETHSARVKPGDLFVALPGVSGHGVCHVDQALARGAVAVLSDRARPTHIPEAIEWIHSEQASALFVELAHADATRGIDMRGDVVHMPLIAVTGTNGKSTVTHGLYSLFNALGRPTGLFGTVEYRFREMTWTATHTTPDLLSFLRISREMQAQGAKGAILEVSSHALDQHRLAGCRFRGAVFTNLTQDHLDYHPDMESYYRAKASLFSEHWLDADAVAVINIDDPWGKRLSETTPARVVTYALQDPHAQFSCHSLRTHLGGSTAVLVTPTGTYPFSTPLIGTHNLYNLLAIAATADAFGYDMAQIVAHLGRYSGLRGRLERVSGEHPFHIFVDYAHTPDALHHVLKSLKPLVTRGQLWVVFGCGGNRDAKKRPLMGAEAARFADRLCVTSDNPRREDPEQIMREIVSGIPENIRAHTHIEVDRARAIQYCIAKLQAGDLLVIAGKGHEQYQMIGDQVLAFDDAKVVRECLQQL